MWLILKNGGGSLDNDIAEYNTESVLYRPLMKVCQSKHTWVEIIIPIKYL